MFAETKLRKQGSTDFNAAPSVLMVTMRHPLICKDFTHIFSKSVSELLTYFNALLFLLNAFTLLFYGIYASPKPFPKI